MDKIQEITEMLINLDPLERKRILNAVNDRLEIDRLKKLNSAKKEILKYES